MKRKIAQAFITAALISSMAVSPVFATPSVEDLQNDKAAAEDEVVSLQSELTGILDKISTLESDLQKKQEEIDQANIDLEEAIVQQDKQYEDMKKRIQYMYESGSGNELELLLSAESFSDLVNKAEYIKNVHTYDRQKQEEYVATTEKIEKLSESLQEEAESMNQMQSQLENDKASLGTMIEGKQSEIAQLDADIQEAVAAQQAEEEARRQQEAQAAAAAAAASTRCSPAGWQQPRPRILPPASHPTAVDLVAAVPAAAVAPVVGAVRSFLPRGQTDGRWSPMRDSSWATPMYTGATA